MAEKENNLFDVWEFNKEMRKITADHVMLLMDQFKTLRGIYGVPDKNLNETVKDYLPKSSSQFFQIFNFWVQEQVKLFETLIQEAIKDYTRGVKALEFRAQNKDRLMMLLDEHAKLWTQNYKKLRERREDIYNASLDSIKKMLPVPVHPMLDNANRWLMEQYKRLEDEMIERIKRHNLKKR
jgi:hypothetical protein